MNAPSLSLFLAGGNTQAAEWLRWHAIENYSRTSIPTPSDVARMRHDEAFMWRMLVSSCYGANVERLDGASVTAPVPVRNVPLEFDFFDANTYAYPNVNPPSAYPSQTSTPAPLLAPFPNVIPAYTAPQNTNRASLSARHMPFQDTRPDFTNPFDASSTIAPLMQQMPSQLDAPYHATYIPSAHQAQSTTDRRASRMNSVVFHDTYNLGHDAGYTNVGPPPSSHHATGYPPPQQYAASYPPAPSTSRHPPSSRVPSIIPSSSTPRDIYSPVHAVPAPPSGLTAPRRPSTLATKKDLYHRRPCPSGNGSCRKPNAQHNGTTVWQQQEFVSHYLQDHIPHMGHLRDRNGLMHCEFGEHGCPYTSGIAKDLAKHVFREHGASTRS